MQNAFGLQVSGVRIERVRTVAIVAPASRPEPEAIATAEAILQTEGLEVSTDPRTYGDAGWTAGSDAERLAALNAALTDPQIDCILCARGGFGSPKIADAAAYPVGRKVIVGYSDNTYLLSRLAGLDGVTVVHGPMAMEFANPAKAVGCEALLRLLRGEDLSAMWTHAFAQRTQQLAAGPVDARLRGGNLATIQLTLGTPASEAFQGAALMVEDAGERMYELDRMLDHLRRAGVLDRAAALLVGDMDPKPEAAGFGRAHLHEALTALGERLGKPVYAGLPIGHGEINLPIVWDARVRIETPVA